MNPPNLLILFADQLRRDALACYGDPNVSTPNIDALAARGVRFANASSTFPICVPFRFTMMTGEYAHSRFVPAIEWRMSPAERTLADEFNEADYHTAYFGKWHLYGGHGLLPHSTHRRPVPREHQGHWQKWVGFELMNAPFNSLVYEDDDPRPRKLPGYQTDGLFDLAMDHIRERPKEKPFCAVVSVEPPHFPYEAPKEDAKRWKDRELTLPDNFMREDPEAEFPPPKISSEDRGEALEKIRTYYAMIENFDRNVGRMSAFLEAEGLADNTIVIVMADHGEAGGRRNVCTHAKDHPTEECVGIPFIVADPGAREREGTVIEDPICSEDLFPTFLGLCGLTPRDSKPGLNLSPLIRGEQESLDREGVLLEFVHDLREGEWFPYHQRQWRAFRTRQHLYATLGNARGGGRPWLLYDLDRDPLQMHNLLNRPEAGEVAGRLHRLLRQRLIDTGDHYPLAPAWSCEGLNLSRE